VYNFTYVSRVDTQLHLKNNIPYSVYVSVFLSKILGMQSEFAMLLLRSAI